MIERLLGKRAQEALVTAGSLTMLGGGIALLHLFLVVARNAIPH
jgi:hypothetical protein